MAAFPLYSPLICWPGWEPDFVAGSESCVLQSGDATRARLGGVVEAGGTFFRSINTGAIENVNAITITCTIVDSGTNGDEDWEDISVVVKAPWISDETYNFTQTYDTNLASCVGLSGPEQLRAAVQNGSPASVITLPTIDDIGTGTITSPVPWDSGTDDADCFMTAFLETNLSGAVGLPANDTDLRTGPTYALFHIANAEVSATGLPLESFNGISAWNPFTLSWDEFPIPTEDLYEIDAGGNITPTPPCP